MKRKLREHSECLVHEKIREFLWDEVMVNENIEMMRGHGSGEIMTGHVFGVSGGCRLLYPGYARAGAGALTISIVECRFADADCGCVVEDEDRADAG